MALTGNDLLHGSIENHVPPLDQVKEVFHKSLSENFENVEVDIVNCPDLTKSPFNRTHSGFGRNMVIADVGGPMNLFPLFHIDRQFNVSEIATICANPEATVFGPGAGPWPVVGQNCEMVCDVNLKTGLTATKICEIKPNGDKPYTLSTTDRPEFSLMANLAVSDTHQEASQTVHFKVSVRKGDKNLTDCLREGLQAAFGTQPVSMAGQFIMHTGKAKLHVMPDFPGCPFASEEEVKHWIHYFEMGAPLVAATVMHSYDPGLNLRMEHTHCYSEHGDGGHYHYDVTPETVSYEGWFAPSSRVYRIANERVPPRV